MNWWTAAQMLSGREAICFAAGLTVALCILARALRRPSLETHKRGALLRDGVAWQRRGARLKARRSDVLTLAGVPVPFADEAKHFKLVGATGTGKSTAIRELLARALARGDRAVFADPDGGYCRRFFDRYRGDIVLNPFERDSLKWDLFSEVNCSYDVEQLVSGLVSATHEASAAEWRGYARTFLAAVMRRCWAEHRTDGEELWRLLAVAPCEELQSDRRRNPRTTLSRSRECPDVRIDPLGRDVRDCRIRARAGAARRAVFRPPMGTKELRSRNIIHSLQSRTNCSAQVDDRCLDSARHLRGHERQ